jgi:WD40 repeat protein
MTPSIIALALGSLVLYPAKAAQVCGEPSFLSDPREEYAPIVSFSQNGMSVIYASRRLRTGELSTATGKNLRHLRLDEPALLEGFPPLAIRFSADNQLIITTDIKVWDRLTGKATTTIALGRPAFGIDVSRDNRHVVATTHGSGKVRLFSFSNPNMKRTLSHKGVSSVAFAPNGKLVVEGHIDGQLRLWEVASAKPIADLKSRGKLPVQAVSFSPNSSVVAAGSRDGIVRLWSLQKGSEVFTATFPDTGFFSVAFSPNGNKLAAGTFDGDICIWTLGETTKLYKKMTGHRWVVHSLCFSEDGLSLVSGSYDQTIRLWDVKSGRQLWKHQVMK